jgi:hypothetical protein
MGLEATPEVVPALPDRRAQGSAPQTPANPELAASPSSHESRASFPRGMLAANGSRGILSPATVALLDRKDSAVNRIALDKEDEAVKRFVLSLPVAANGSVLELEGRAVACVVPIIAEPVEANDAWSEAKNARRCALIDKEIDGRLSAAEAVELHRLQREMLAHRHTVAPLPLAEARQLHQKLLAKARRRPSE